MQKKQWRNVVETYKTYNYVLVKLLKNSMDISDIILTFKYQQMQDGPISS